MIKKLRIKFIMINMTMVTLMLGILLGMVYHFTRANLETESVTMMRGLAAKPIHSERPDEPPPDLRLPYFTLRLNPAGEIIESEGGFFDLTDEELLRELVEASSLFRQDVGVLHEHSLRFLRMYNPRGVTLVFADMSSEENTLENLLRTLLLTGSGSLLLFLAISIFLSRWAVQPVEQAWRQQKQFISDASHELKTPLTVIMTNAELLNDGAGDEESRGSFSRSILIMARQMRSLVEQMLLLARSEERQEELLRENVDLSALAEDAAISFEGVFMDKGLLLESEVEENCRVRGSSGEIKRVMDILLDNAQKYSTPGGTVRLSLRCTGCRCRLSVENPGPALSEAECRDIFRRFYRTDEARGSSGSFGLGLPIAERIVVNHKGRIWCESRGGINRFLVELKRI